MSDKIIDILSPPLFVKKKTHGKELNHQYLTVGSKF